MNNHLVTVLLPVYNEKKFVGKAIQSIIDQIFPDWQLFVIDDGSTDGTWDIINQFSLIDSRIFCFRNEKNCGISNSLNFGIARTNTKYIARMDADDYSYPNRLGTQLAFMEANEEIDVLGAGARLVSIDGSEIGFHLRPTNQKDLNAKIHLQTPFIHPTIFAKTSFFKKWPYSNDFYQCEDYELWLRTYPYARFHNLQEIAIDYTVKNQTSIKRQLIHLRCLLESKNIDVQKKVFAICKSFLIIILIRLKIFIPSIKSTNFGQ